MDPILIEELEKLATITSTSPQYITPEGKIFTATDLVKGRGFLDHNGKKIKPTKWKAHSLSEKVNSKDFGKVRKS